MSDRPTNVDEQSAVEQGEKAQRNPQLLMVRPSLEDLPPLPVLPAGYSVRVFQPGDEERLAATMTAAFLAFRPHAKWSASDVLRDPVGAPGVTRTFVAVSEADGVVATSSARDAPQRFPGKGYIHWVAADPAHQGKGLGRAVMLHCLLQFRAQGHSGAVLETDDDLLPAIRLYLALGFTPDDSHPSYAQRWQQVMAALHAER